MIEAAAPTPPREACTTITGSVDQAYRVDIFGVQGDATKLGNHTDDEQPYLTWSDNTVQSSGATG